MFCFSFLSSLMENFSYCIQEKLPLSQLTQRSYIIYFLVLLFCHQILGIQRFLQQGSFKPIDLAAFLNYFCHLGPLNHLNNSTRQVLLGQDALCKWNITLFHGSDGLSLDIQNVYQEKGYLFLPDLPALDSKLLILVLSDLLEKSLLYYALQEILIQTLNP